MFLWGIDGQMWAVLWAVSYSRLNPDWRLALDRFVGFKEVLIFVRQSSKASLKENPINIDLWNRAKTLIHQKDFSLIICLNIYFNKADTLIG
jgi:hypothetical protein